MGQNISLVGNWTGVSGIYLEKTGGGMVKYTDTSPTTATDPDVAQGKVYFKADGSQSTGTGGSPTVTLQAKTKTYTPTTSEQSEDVTPDSGYDGLSKVSVTVGAIQTESKSATPSETAQTITPSSGKFLSSVSVVAIPDNYVGTGIARRSDSSVTVDGPQVVAPAGYYGSQVTKSVATATHPDPNVSIDSNGLIKATHTQGTGYVTGGTTTSTLQVDARDSSDLTVSGQTVTAPAGYYPEAASKTVTVAQGSATTPATTITANPTISVDTDTGEVTATVSGSQSITPTVSPGYVSQGTAGTVSVSGSGTHQLTLIDDTQIEGTITERTGQFALRTNVVDIPAGWSPGLSPANLFPEMVVSTVNGYSIDTSGNLTFNFSPQTAGIAYRTKSYEVTGSMQVAPGATITPSRQQQTAIMADHYATGAILVDPIPSNYIIPTGTKQITANGTGIDVSSYAAVDVAVPSGTPNLQSKSVSYTPTETAQSGTVSPDTGYDGLSSVNVSVGAISSTYVGSGVARRTSSNLTESGGTVTAPAGYYAADASKSVASGSARTPATTITANPTITIDGTTGEITASVSASKSITPTVSAGYVSAGAAGTVTASGSATEQLTVLTDEDVYGTVTDTASTRTNEVVIPAGLVPTGGIRPEIFSEAFFDDTDASFSIGTNGSITANFNPRFAGMAYTHGNYSITKAGAVSVQAGGRITPTESQQIAIPGGTYALEAILVDGIPTTYVGSGITRRTSSSMTEAQGNITAPAGYYASNAVFEMQDVGHPDPTISVSSSGLITASLTQPEGWTQGGNASATRQLDTDAGGTITPSSARQHVVQAGTYVTGDLYVNPIPGEYIIPTGTTTITENGEYDVTDFETAIVNVAAAAGLEYETGTWTPDSDIARGTISFSNSHSEPPVAIILADSTGTAHSATNSNYMFTWFDVQRFTGHGYPYSSSGFRYAAAYYSYRGSSTSSISSAGYLCSQQTTSSSASGVTYPKYWATATEFHPYSNSTSRYWRSGRSYKWIAIWKP